jgi:hypothetical protein
MNDASGIACHDSACWHVSDDHGTCAYGGILPHLDATDDRCIGPCRHAITNDRRLAMPLSDDNVRGNSYSLADYRIFPDDKRRMEDAQSLTDGSAGDADPRVSWKQTLTPPEEERTLWGLRQSLSLFRHPTDGKQP